MSTHILLLRHAATNPGGRLCGSFDVPLAREGRAQVRAVLERRPPREVPDALYTSTLTRATEVAAALGLAWSLAPNRAEWAREIDCGHVEGMPLDLLRQQFPELWVRNEAGADEHFAWPGGESYRQFRRRVLSGLQRAVAAHSGRRIAVVTHAGVISQVVGTIRSRPASAWQLDRPDPFTATEVTWDNGAPKAVLMFNEPDWF